MESLQLKTDLRNSLYFGKFEYKAIIGIRNVWSTRYAEYWSDKDFDSVLAKRLAVSKAENKKQLAGFAKWRSSVFRLVDRNLCRWNTSTNQFILYSNNLELLESATIYGSTSAIFKVKIIDPKSENLVMYFKRTPLFKYRTYLNFNNYGKEYNEVLDYFRSLQNSLAKEGKISFCPSIKRAIFGDFVLLNKSNFVDHNDPGFTTILRLMHPKYVHRTYELKLSPLINEGPTLHLPFE